MNRPAQTDSRLCIFQGDEFRHIVLAMLVTAIFFLLFVFDAIIRENAFGLLASMVMAACVAGRVVYYVVSHLHFFLSGVDRLYISMLRSTRGSSGLPPVCNVAGYMMYRIMRCSA